MKHIALSVILLIVSSFSSIAQKKQKTFKYAYALEANVGYTFPRYNIKEQDRWSPKLYIAASVYGNFIVRFNQNWRIDFGLGGTHYSMANASSSKQLLMTFTTPKIVTSLNYTFLRYKKHIFFAQLASGVHLGFKNVAFSRPAYDVAFSSSQRYHYFFKPEIGYRKYFKHKMKGKKFKNPYEFGIFYQYNITSIGEALVTEDDFEIIMMPKGEIIGLYYRIIIPFGKRRMIIYQQNKTAKKPAPIIFNPRF